MISPLAHCVPPPLLRSGFLIFYMPGSLEQIVLALFLSVICIVVYNNAKPYAKNSNDWLQQLCQFSIFVVLLSALVLQVDAERRSSTTINAMLFAGTLIPPLLTIPMLLIGDHGKKSKMMQYSGLALARCAQVAKGMSPRGRRKPANQAGDVSETAGGGGFSFSFRSLARSVSSERFYRSRPPRAKIEDDDGVLLTGSDPVSEATAKV